jgi:CysZ protein
MALVFRLDVPDLRCEFWGGFGAWLSGVLSGLGEFLKYLVLLPLLLLAAYLSFTTVGMVLASPWNDLLSERVEDALCGERPAVEMPWKRRFRAMGLSLLDSLGIALLQIFFTLLTLPFLLIPVVGAAPMFLVNAYFAGRGFLEAGTARNFLRRRHVRCALRGRRRQILGLGVAMELLFLVPGVGLLMLPLGVTAGTFLYCRIDWESLLRENGLDRPEGFLAPRLANRSG